jgi:hypothetical protein
MKHRSRLACVGAGLLAFTGGAYAQGYFPFDEIPGIDSEPTVQIDLDPELMSMFGAAAKGADQGAASALEGITNVRVRVYEDIAAGARDGLLKFVEDASRTLESDGWKSVVRVNEDGERVRIFVKPAAAGANAGTFEGLTVMVVDTGGGSEAVFINVAGVIRPEQLGSLAAQVGMNGMFDMVPGVPNSRKPAPNE